MALDRTPEGGWTPGGPSLFAARAFQALDARVTLVTSLESDFEESVFDGLEVRAARGVEVPRFENSYDHAGNRKQFLLAEGSPLALVPHVSADEVPDIALIAPAFHEFRRAPLRFKGSIVGVSLQGPLRAITGRQRVIHHSHPTSVVERFLRPGWLGFFSEEDTAEPDALAEHIARLGAVAILTRGHNGATLFDSDGTQEHWDALPADPVDPTGAGDCFASAFLFRLAETEDLTEAMPFALAAGALAVEEPGLDGIATREEIEARMNWEAA